MERIATGCYGGQICKWVQRETSPSRIDLTKPIKYEVSDGISGLKSPETYIAGSWESIVRYTFPCPYFLFLNSYYWPQTDVFYKGRCTVLNMFIGVVLWKATRKDLLLERACFRKYLLLSPLGPWICQVKCTRIWDWKHYNYLLPICRT